jgi:hypothetical protein
MTLADYTISLPACHSKAMPIDIFTTLVSVAAPSATGKYSFVSTKDAQKAVISLCA